MKKGFTLIELMIVVAIIGILSAIAIPKFAELLDKSKVRQNYAKQIEARPYDKAKLTDEMNGALAKWDAEHGRNQLASASSLNTVATSYSVKYQLSNGAIVACMNATIHQGGIDLMNCEDGRTYLMQTNVVKFN